MALSAANAATRTWSARLTWRIVSNAVDPRELHGDAVVVDAHNDLPVLLLLRNRELGEQGAARYWSERNDGTAISCRG